MMKDSQNGEGNSFLNFDELNSSDYRLIQVDPDKVVSSQSDKFDGLRIIVEGECYVSCDAEKIREIYPELMVDHRKQVVNIQSLKNNLKNYIIPSIKDHDVNSFLFVDEKPTYKSKYIRTLIMGDKIGDFEFSLKLNQNLFKITNSSSILLLLFIPITSFQKLSKRAPQFIKDTIETTILKCSTYLNEKNFTILFNNIHTKLKLAYHGKSDKHLAKKPMTDFEATIKLYEANSSTLVPSYIPNSMNMLWKMKQSEEYWKKKIQERKFDQEKENEIKINYFRSSHHQKARSNKALEKLKQNNTSDNKKQNEQLYGYSSQGVITSAKIPINHPSVASVWTVLKAVRKFKHNSNLITTNKIAKSKSQIIKSLPEQSLFSENDDPESDEDEQIDFDIETSDKNLRSIENRMKTFLNSLPKTSQPSGISTLKRYVVNGKSIPQLGGTILVRYKQCNPCEEHEHIQHFILPKDALSTLQKYRASRPHTTEKG